MDKKHFKLIISVFIVLVIIIILTIMLLILNIKESSNNEQPNIGDPGIELDFSNSKIEKVTENAFYYTVRNCINNYLDYLNNNNSIYYIGGEQDLEIQKEIVYNLLNSEYIKKQNINVKNVLNNIKTVNQKQIFIPLQINMLEKQRINKYIAYGIIQTEDNKFLEESYFIIDLDKINKTFSIEPVEQEYTDIDEIKIENNDVPININDSNVYMEQVITNEYMATEYFELYKKLAISNPNIIYNMMDKEYREARFGNLESFLKYVNDNIDEIKNINLKQYLVNNYNDYVEYVGKDQYGNLYIFNEYNDGRNTNIKLDTYTIPTDKFISEYQKASEQEKVQMNIDKFMQMINRHDYRTSYNCISKGFKDNYFNTQEDFENTIKYNFFDYNKFEFSNFEKKGSNIYVCTVKLTDLTEQNQASRNVNFIIKLNENLDFEMSFGM